MKHQWFVGIGDTGLVHSGTAKRRFTLLFVTANLDKASDLATHCVCSTECYRVRVYHVESMTTVRMLVDYGHSDSLHDRLNYARWEWALANQAWEEAFRVILRREKDDPEEDETVEIGPNPPTEPAA